MNIIASVGEVPHIGKHIAVVRLTEKRTTDERVHHTTLLLDCSGSMAHAIDQVRRDSVRFVEGLSEEEYVSVIAFSGHKEARLLAGPTKCDKDGKALVSGAIDAGVRIIGVTVFSEPLALALEAVRRKSVQGLAHSAVLFTDGCAVPQHWDVAEEQQRALHVVADLREFGATVSAIGYGVYYDDAFLGRLMGAAGNSGVYRHISEIDEFGAAVASIRDAARRTVPASFTCTVTPSKGTAGRVFKTTPELTVRDEGGRMTVRGLFDGAATLFVELSGPTTALDVAIADDGETQTKRVKPTALSDADAADYVRALGAWAFLTGDRALAGELLAQTQDDAVAERAAAAFTEREQREVGGLFRWFFVDRSFIGAGLKPKGPNHNALNVLRTLIEDEGSTVFIPQGAYKRSGELTADPRVVHPPHGRKLTVVGMRSNGSRFTFSLLTLKDVQVLPEEGDGPPVDMQIWRTYNVILDGNLHLPELEATLSAKSFATLQEAGVIAADETYKRTRVYRIDLRAVKLISSSWAHPATLGLVNLLQEEKELEAEQTALNARRKATGVPASDEEHAIYRERAEKVDGRQVETYQADCVEVRLMGYKAKAYDCSSMDYATADARVREVRNRLATVRFITRAIVFAMERTGSRAIAWGAATETKRGKSPKQEQLASFQGAELKRVAWRETFVCS